MSQPAGAAVGTHPPKAVVELVAADLTPQGLTFCPNPKMALWSNHPRVFLPVGAGNEGRCPYCGTLYRMQAGAKVPGGH